MTQIKFIPPTQLVLPVRQEETTPACRNAALRRAGTDFSPWGSILFFLVISIFISGCSQPLRTLMDLGSEKNAQGNFVKKQNLKMDMLLRDIKKGRLKKGMSSPFIIARYGEPVLKIKTTFVYRNAVEFFHTPKVYLDFDEKGLLMDIRLENQHEGEIRAKQSQ